MDLIDFKFVLSKKLFKGMDLIEFNWSDFKEEEK